MMHRSAIITGEKAETSMMREASSASPSGSSAALNAEGVGGAPSGLTTASPPAPPPKCHCMCCSKPMSPPDPDLPRLPKEENDLAEEHGRTRNLMDCIAAASVPMDAPVCKECAEQLQSGMSRQLEMLEDDCLHYSQLVKDLSSRFSNVNVAEYKAKIEKLKKDETDLTAELRALILEEEKVDRELSAEKRALEQTSAQEEELWARLRDYHSYMIKNDQEVREMNMEIRYIDSQLRMLTRTSVLSLAFPIEVTQSSPSSLPIAAINGFRLGRLPDVQIDWPEINAAWGQALLLLDILMKRAHCALPGVEFVTLHSSSAIRVERGNAVKEYPLHAAGSWKPFGNKNMDGGAAIFMEALALLCNTISDQAKANGGVQVEWPHRIRGDRLIADDMEYTVKMQFSAEERWTNAMRAMLLNLKWAAAMINIEKA
ncbi:hypothetical protein PMAYCL1PPCAC_19920 [Pristionchus mayeri]|uniref:Uncharacterized protein n=1 Tax=Pristionchus mayeri TaxID=1317129 RepID=A0AAN5I341_9BILA|nr:hypothetical protein PMAYCL1PPCAC_19920 [Pristionchus mayeri]